MGLRPWELCYREDGKWYTPNGAEITRPQAINLLINEGGCKEIAEWRSGVGEAYASHARYLRIKRYRDSR